jgi:hypothetical protein
LFSVVHRGIVKVSLRVRKICSAWVSIIQRFRLLKVINSECFKGWWRFLPHNSPFFRFQKQIISFLSSSVSEVSEVNLSRLG